MTRLGPYEVHPFADAFPLIDGEEFGNLVLDVKKNGLRDPIILSHDKTILIDGRNRYRACMAAGVDLVHETLGIHYTEMMILDLIVSKNVARRQLNAGQRALMALEYERFYAAAVKADEKARKIETPSNQYTTGSSATTADLRESRHERESAAKAAKAVGASGRTVQQAAA